MSERDKSPRRSMCAAILSLEAITLGLTTPVMIAISDVEPSLALSTGLGLAGVAVVTAGLLRAPWAYGLGWAVQAGAIALGFLTPLMWFLGPIFALLWGSADHLGRRIERERADAFAAFDREEALRQRSSESQESESSQPPG